MTLSENLKATLENIGYSDNITKYKIEDIANGIFEDGYKLHIWSGEGDFIEMFECSKAAFGKARKDNNNWDLLAETYQEKVFLSMDGNYLAGKMSCHSGLRSFVVTKT